MKRRSETSVNKNVLRALRGLDPFRVENAVGPGTPDIAYVGGWIEDKYLPAWPKGETTPVRVPHYKPDQRAWHVRHRVAGGNVHVVIEIAGESMVYDAALAAQFLGFWTRREMYANAALHLRKWDDRAFRNFIDTAKVVVVAFKPQSGITL